MTTHLEPINVGVERLPHACPELPEYQTEGSAAMDLQAALTEPLTLKPLGRALIPTGLKVNIPDGYELQIRARSGLASKHGITLPNGIGTIDWDYRDELKVALINLSEADYTIHPGDRIAQLMIVPVYRIRWQEVATVGATNRNGGFGSTGR